jgi:tetratricopeptide (TPR) repeat protein
LLFPTLGVVRFTNVIASDKFVYLPAIGLLLALAGGLAALWRRAGRLPRLRGRAWRAALVVGPALLAVPLMVATHRHYATWRTAEAHYRYLLALTPQVPPLHYVLAQALQRQGRLAEALPLYRTAIRLDPGYVVAHGDLAAVLWWHGQTAEAVAHWKRALGVEPTYYIARSNLGYAIEAQGDLARTRGKEPEARALYARALGQYRLALEGFRATRPGEPDDGQLHAMLGHLLVKLGETEEGIRELRQGLALAPGFAPGHQWLREALATAGEGRPRGGPRAGGAGSRK